MFATLKDYCLHRGFSYSVLLTFWARYPFAAGDCLVHFQMFNSIPGFYSLDAISASSPVVTTKIVSDVKCPLKGKMAPFENHWPRLIISLEVAKCWYSKYIIQSLVISWCPFIKTNFPSAAGDLQWGIVSPIRKAGSMLNSFPLSVFKELVP